MLNQGPKPTPPDKPKWVENKKYLISISTKIPQQMMLIIFRENASNTHFNTHSL